MNALNKTMTGNNQRMITFLSENVDLNSEEEVRGEQKNGKIEFEEN